MNKCKKCGKEFDIHLYLEDYFDCNEAKNNSAFHNIGLCHECFLNLIISVLRKKIIKYPLPYGNLYDLYEVMGSMCWHGVHCPFCENVCHHPDRHNKFYNSCSFTDEENEDLYKDFINDKNRD